jgi:hypothetical protein
MRHDYSDKEILRELDEMVRKGYLKRTSKGFIDSDEVTALLKKGKTRKEIKKILENRKED